MVGLEFLALGNQGGRPEGCPNFGNATANGFFGDADCDGQVTTRDDLVVLIAAAGATQLPLPTGCSLDQPA